MSPGLIGVLIICTYLQHSGSFHACWYYRICLSWQCRTSNCKTSHISRLKLTESHTCNQYILVGTICTHNFMINLSECMSPELRDHISAMSKQTQLATQYTNAIMFAEDTLRAITRARILHHSNHPGYLYITS